MWADIFTAEGSKTNKSELLRESYKFYPIEMIGSKLFKGWENWFRMSSRIWVYSLTMVRNTQNPILETTLKQVEIHYLSFHLSEDQGCVRKHVLKSTGNFQYLKALPLRGHYTSLKKYILLLIRGINELCMLYEFLLQEQPLPGILLIYWCHKSDSL